MDLGKTRCLQEWGKELLREFPGGLADEPDFDSNGAARLDWLSRGYSLGVRWASELGMGGKVYLSKIYDDPNALDEAGKAEFARTAFNLGRLYSEIAKIEAEKEAKHQAEQRDAIADVDAQVDILRREISGISSREDLRIRIADAKERSLAARSSGNSMEDYAYSRQVSTLQDRLIEIEAQEARRATSGWWITLAGTVAGVAGLILGYFLAGTAD